MRFTSPLLALLLAAVLGWWFVLREPPAEEPAAMAEAPAEEAAQAAPEAVPVLVLETRAEPATDLVVLRGRTEANRLVQARAETAGQVISEPLRAGAEIAAGDLLCRLDPGARLAQLAEAEAQLAKAEAEANAARTLSEKGFTAETTRKARDAELQAAQAQLDLVRLDIARLEIHAPFAGILESDTAELGARLGVGDACATIIDLSTVKVAAFASELDVGRIREGQPVDMRLINGDEYSGRVTFISRMADSDTRTYTVEAQIPNADGGIRDGMTAELRIALEAEPAHRIPQAALTLDDAGRLGVRLAEAGASRFYPVRILRDEASGVWVSGLPEIAHVIVVGQEFVGDGRAILPTPVSWDDLG